MGFKKKQASAQLKRHAAERPSNGLVEQPSGRRGKAANRHAKHALKQAKQQAKRQRKARNQREYKMRCRVELS